MLTLNTIVNIQAQRPVTQKVIAVAEIHVGICFEKHWKIVGGNLLEMMGPQDNAVDSEPRRPAVL